jgi:hypothetical protein
MEIGKIGLCTLACVAASLSAAPVAQAHFLQTDPVGYKDDLDLYSYVGGDPINHSDPTGLSCTGYGNTVSCHIDQIQTPKDRALTTTERKQIAAFERAYTNAVRTLETKASINPNFHVNISIGGKTFSAYAGDVARTMSQRNVTADVGDHSRYSGYTPPRGYSFVTANGLAGVGPRGPEGEREVTAVHEFGLHQGPGEHGQFAPTDPATTDHAHDAKYNRAADELLLGHP